MDVENILIIILVLFTINKLDSTSFFAVQIFNAMTIDAIGPLNPGIYTQYLL